MISLMETGTKFSSLNIWANQKLRRKIHTHISVMMMIKECAAWKLKGCWNFHFFLLPFFYHLFAFNIEKVLLHYLLSIFSSRKCWKSCETHKSKLEHCSHSLFFYSFLVSIFFFRGVRFSSSFIYVAPLYIRFMYT